MLKELLLSLRMKGALNSLETVSKIKGKDEFARALLQAECDYRHQQALERGIKKASFPIDKTWNEIDHTLNCVFRSKRSPIPF